MLAMNRAMPEAKVVRARAVGAGRGGSDSLGRRAGTDHSPAGCPGAQDNPGTPSTPGLNGCQVSRCCHSACVSGTKAA